METKKIEIKDYKNVYVAADGTEFDIQGECEAYEKSALGVLKIRLSKMSLVQKSECELFYGSGCDDNTSYVVIPKNEEEVGVIQQLVFLKAYSKEEQAKKVAVGKVLVVTLGYEDECLWVTDLGDLVDKATDGKAEVKVK
jgi:hypothetical protein